MTTATTARTVKTKLVDVTAAKSVKKMAEAHGGYDFSPAQDPVTMYAFADGSVLIDTEEHGWEVDESGYWTRETPNPTPKFSLKR